MMALEETRPAGVIRPQEDGVGGPPPGSDERLVAPAPGALDHGEVVVVSGGDPQAERALHRVGALELLVFAQRLGVERLGLDRAAQRTATVVLGVVIGVALGPEG